jgi:hypothetical protein
MSGANALSVEADEARARIDQLRAQEAKALAEADKARFERHPWRLPATWMLLIGAIGGLGTAGFQWQKSQVVAERAALNADKAQYQLEQRQQALAEASVELDQKLLALAEAEAGFAKLQGELAAAQGSLVAAQTQVAALSATAADKAKVIADLEAAATRAGKAESAADSARMKTEVARLNPNLIARDLRFGRAGISPRPPED